MEWVLQLAGLCLFGVLWGIVVRAGMESLKREWHD